MFDLRPVLKVTGVVLAVLALAMCLPAVVDAVHDNADWLVFAGAAAVTFLLGLLLVAANRDAHAGDLTVRQVFLLSSAGWVAVSVAGALPFVFAGLHLSPTDAMFEAVSGITTTGATAMRGLDAAPPGILLWRALLQWLGGVGFLVMAVTVLPALNIGGMQIFRPETSGLGDSLTPRIARLAGTLAGIYAALTGLLALLLWAAGMSRFPALLHAMTTISCGGFSTSDGSIGHWHDPEVDWVVLLGMLAGGTPFIIYLQLLQRRWRAALQNTQLRWYLGIVGLATLVIYGWLIMETNMKPLPALRHAAFTAASVMTGTGFATVDWGQWSGLPTAVLFFLTFVGGCAGSTAGGIKIFRLHVLYVHARSQMIRMLRPHALVMPQYERRFIPDAVAESVLGFLFLYMLSFALVAMALGMVGLDFGAAISASAAALANLGPGLTASVGPLAGYAAVPDAAKWLLVAAMLFGRLEMFLVLVLFTRSFWRP